MEDNTELQWNIYILECADGTLYTGIAKGDINRRVAEHNEDDQKGAKYTRSRRPVRLAYLEQAECRSTAAQREYAIKKLSRVQKQKMIKCS